MENGRFILQAGAAHGVTKGAVFSVYRDMLSAVVTSGTEPVIGSLTASNPTPFSTNMVITPETPEFDIGTSEAFALQTRVGEEEAMRIHIQLDNRLEGVFRAVAQEMTIGTNIQQTLQLVDEREKAELDLFLENDKVVFGILDPLVRIHGLTRMPYTVDTAPANVYPVIRAAAHYRWHLRRTSHEQLLQKKVKVQFNTLVETDEFDDDLHFLYRPNGPNLLEDGKGIVDIKVDGKTLYGIKIINELDIDLYASLFYFDNSDLSISESFHLPLVFKICYLS